MGLAEQDCFTFDLAGVNPQMLRTCNFHRHPFSEGQLTLCHPSAQWVMTTLTLWWECSQAFAFLQAKSLAWLYRHLVIKKIISRFTSPWLLLSWTNNWLISVLLFLNPFTFSSLLFQMDHLHKALIGPGFQVAPPLRKAPSSCSVCRLKFNSEVGGVSTLQNKLISIICKYFGTNVFPFFFQVLQNKLICISCKYFGTNGFQLFASPSEQTVFH